MLSSPFATPSVKNNFILISFFSQTFSACDAKEKRNFLKISPFFYFIRSQMLEDKKIGPKGATNGMWSRGGRHSGKNRVSLLLTIGVNNN
jgi:hypothetical protein